jgi:nitrite reductase/ring-hydroxylating ferredoxin subunit
MKIRIFLHIALILLFLGCNKNKQHPVPYFSFDSNINLNLPTYNSLKGVGGWAYVTGVGSKGVVVYRQSVERFVAFDRQSPAEGGLDCESGLVTDDDNFLILNDPCSNAQFSLYDGSIIGGDTEWGLRKYQTGFNGGDVLRIYNP